MNESDRNLLFRLEEFASTKLKEHQLKQNGWSFRWDRAKRRFGSCDFTRKQITLSRSLAQLNTFEASADTILHEIAHALAGREAGHGAAWIEACKRVGARPERCYNNKEINTPSAPYVRYCPSCFRSRPMHRRSQRKFACGFCCKKHTNGLYSEAYRLLTVKRDEFENLRKTPSV